MTKLRAPLTFDLALERVAGVVGWSRVAEILGVAYRTVRDWTDPDTTPDVGCSVTLAKAVQLDVDYRAAGGEGAPMLQCFALLVETSLADACVSAVERARAAAKAAKENGEALQAQILASLPGACPGTIQIARRETEEAISAQVEVLTTLTLEKPASTLRGPEVPPSVPSG
ncbi:MAG: hypothetical protein ACK40O_00935 [Allosphingosinicella sp.]